MDVPQCPSLGKFAWVFLEGVGKHIQQKLVEGIQALGGVKFQLAIKIQLKRTNSVAQSTHILRSVTNRKLPYRPARSSLARQCFAHHSRDVSEMDPTRLWLGGRQNPNSLTGHRPITVHERKLLRITISGNEKKKKSSHQRKRRR